jgi:hypothetical protein
MLSKLYKDKLLLDLIYWRRELEIKKEIVAMASSEFQQLTAPPESSEVEHTDTLERTAIPGKNKGGATDKRTPSNTMLRGIYREIAKQTHPDKVGDSGTEAYIRATDAYEIGDVAGVVISAVELGIDIDMDDKILESIQQSVAGYKSLSNFLENGVVWKWYGADAQERQRIEEEYRRKWL